MFVYIAIALNNQSMTGTCVLEIAVRISVVLHRYTVSAYTTELKAFLKSHIISMLDIIAHTVGMAIKSKASCIKIII